MRFRSFFKKIIKYITFNAYMEALDRELVEVRLEKEKAIDNLPEYDAGGSSIDDRMSHMRILNETGDPMFALARRLRTQENIIFKKKLKIRLYRRIFLLLGVVIMGLMGLLLCPGLGSAIKVEYFATLAQLYPVLLIASYLSTPPVKESADILFMNFVVLKFTGFSLAILGLLTCLIVVAKGRSDTASLLITIITLAFMLYVLMKEVLARR